MANSPSKRLERSNPKRRPKPGGKPGVTKRAKEQAARPQQTKAQPVIDMYQATEELMREMGLTKTRRRPLPPYNEPA
jgi:hypothetical protein